MQNFIDHKACYTEAIKMMEKYKQMEHAVLWISVYTFLDRTGT